MHLPRVCASLGRVSVEFPSGSFGVKTLASEGPMFESDSELPFTTSIPENKHLLFHAFGITFHHFNLLFVLFKITICKEIPVKRRKEHL
ncbi:hypothetical protein GBAR_LOCUS27979 [Geodia barretti]|uniref:Uncharacterized protein n=1 Tax=Geodia barretti TaxID=519541 RepID=A0AA35XHI5_GEOBA|nr:hypothetical protein GBAR_LOCUS27979 [Geodia barretti]